jgi:hypothetical protein
VERAHISLGGPWRVRLIPVQKALTGGAAEGECGGRENRAGKESITVVSTKSKSNDCSSVQSSATHPLWLGNGNTFDFYYAWHGNKLDKTSKTSSTVNTHSSSVTSTE